MQFVIHYYCRYRLLILLLLVSGSLCAGNITGNSVLIVPEDFNVLYVDGHAVSGNFFSPGGAELKLGKGEHRVVMVYDQFFERGEDIDRIKSAPFMLGFVIEQEADYRLHFTAPKTLEAGKDFAKNPQVEVLIPAMKSVLPTQLTHNVDKDVYLASYVKSPAYRMDTVDTKVPASIPRPAPASQQPVVQLSFPASQSSRTGPNALEQLRYWWKQADESQRAGFLQEVQVRP